MIQHLFKYAVYAFAVIGLVSTCGIWYIFWSVIRDIIRQNKIAKSRGRKT